MPKYPIKPYYPNLPDIANDETEEMLAQMIAEIESVYGQAYDELRKKADKFLAWFKVADQKFQDAIASGERTVNEWKRWRTTQLLTGIHWFAMSETMAMDLVNADGIAFSIMNAYIPTVYALNGNWATYTIEKQTQINTSFELFNEQAIERIIRDHPDLLPQPTLNIPKDLQWNKQHIQSAVMQSIIQGEDVYQLADRLASVTDMNENAAIRNARTSITSAQNMGRQDAYERADSMGIKLKKYWVATLDFRTRESHRRMDGIGVGIYDKFPNGLIEPGDPSGDPAEVYNCRCTTITKPDGFQLHNENHVGKLGSMSYEDWKNAHGGEPEFKSARNAKRDKKMWREYKDLLKNQVPARFDDFQNLKYRNTTEWKKMVSNARKVRNRRWKNGR